MVKAVENESQTDGTSSTDANAEAATSVSSSALSSGKTTARSSPTEPCDTLSCPITTSDNLLSAISSAAAVDTADAAVKNPVQTNSACAIADGVSSASVSASPVADNTSVTVNVIYKKQKYPVTCSLDTTVACLKQQLHSLIDVPPAMQKVMVRGLAPDHSTLRQLAVCDGAKLMVVGSTLKDVMSISKPAGSSTCDEAAASALAGADQKLCDAKVHQKVLAKGKPEDVMPCQLNGNMPLPAAPLSGMLNKLGGKVRLTFKLDADQLWIGTRERTEKVNMSTIKTIVSEPISGHEGYHLMGIQLGPTEASRYWIYWVPAQYVSAIRDTVLGKWHYF